MLQNLLKKIDYRPVALQRTIAGHFEIMVSINGIDTNFIVDTGAAKTVIDLGFARKYNLHIQETTNLAGGLGHSRMALFRVNATRLLIGEFVLFLPEIHALDLRHIKQSLLDKGIKKPANGVIGSDVLNHHKAIIDYSNQLLYLQKSRRPAGSD